MVALLIDNYDSFTFNLFQLLAEVRGDEPVVLRNDDVAGWRRLDPAAVDCIVISPGPGRPERERDFGLSRRALDRTDVPVLGVCLGHQGLCHRYGAMIAHADEPVHGRTSWIHHAGGALFRGIPSPFAGVRYHSLVAQHVPAPLEVVATTAEGAVMAVRHRAHPHWGVQFHPESIETRHGRRLLENFCALARGSAAQPAAPGRPRAVGPAPAPARAPGSERPGEPVERAPGSERPYDLHVVPVEHVPDSERAYDLLAGQARLSAWLDSSSVVPGRSRFSVVALPSDDLGEVVTYRVSTGEVVLTRPDGRLVGRRRESVFDHLEREQACRRVDDPGLPCEFALGYVGYLGYELKADCGGAAAHASPRPDASLLFCDRALVIDHARDAGWLLALSTPGTREAVAAWLARAAGDLRDLAARPRAQVPPDLPLVADAAPVAHRLRHPPPAYRGLIAECLRAITDGESYEICLTNMITARSTADPLLTYKVLRRLNPAPYAALLRLGGFDVLSASPERFLTVDRHGAAESRPIKGTRGRAADATEDAARVEELRRSEKDRAENLMVVDLVRNDLGSLAEIGSVHVPSLFAVESFASVHQMVSTVRSRLRAGVSAVRCVQASFPGGSMTGAPKLRTMEILDRLEAGPRGVYSGALGYVSLNGAVDLSIVIRTVVLEGGEATVGTGGAIVALSDPEDEVAETMVKADVLLRALGTAAGLGTPPEEHPSRSPQNRSVQRA